MLAYDARNLFRAPAWRELTPTEWRTPKSGGDELRATGSCGPVRKGYFRKDGVRVPVLVGAAPTADTRTMGGGGGGGWGWGRGGGVGAWLRAATLTERKRADVGGTRR